MCRGKPVAEAKVNPATLADLLHHHGLDALQVVQHPFEVRNVIIASLRSYAANARGPLTLDTDAQVFFYEQNHYYLSNFSAFQVEYGEHLFDTAEQAYHFQRFRTGTHRYGILFASSAHEAFRYAQDHKADQRPDWDDVKLGVMRDILRAKVQQHEYVRRKLLETGDRELIENSWRDPFWGWGPNRDGLNMLGKLWMEVRSELRAVGQRVGVGEEGVE
jgi:N-glycosidase YbiA